MPPTSRARPDDRTIDDRTIGDAVRRLEAAATHREGFGHTTDTSVTTVVDGVRCVAEERSWRLETDLGTSLGGSDTAPTPGVLARAALGSCLAMGYVLRAARHGVELTSIEVTVETDSEVAGMLVTDSDSPAGYTAVRCHVDVASPADHHHVERILDEGDLLSPMMDLFGRPNPVTRTTTIRTRKD